MTQQAPGAGQHWTFTLQKRFGDTALTCTISGDAKEAADLVNGVVFEGHEHWCLKVVSSAGAHFTVNVLFSLFFENLD